MYELKTQRLLLRPLAPQDRDGFLGMVSDWNVVRYLARWPYPANPDMVDALIEQARIAPERGFTILYGGMFAGTIGASPRIGFMLRREFWGLGIMSEALLAVQGHCLTTLGHRELEALVHDDNPQSHKVFAKCGWSRAGRSESWCEARRKPVGETRYCLERKANVA